MKNPLKGEPKSNPRGVELPHTDEKQRAQLDAALQEVSSLLSRFYSEWEHTLRLQRLQEQLTQRAGAEAARDCLQLLLCSERSWSQIAHHVVKLEKLRLQFEKWEYCAQLPLEARRASSKAVKEIASVLDDYFHRKPLHEQIQVAFLERVLSYWHRPAHAGPQDAEVDSLDSGPAKALTEPLIVDAQKISPRRAWQELSKIVGKRWGNDSQGQFLSRIREIIASLSLPELSKNSRGR